MAVLTVRNADGETLFVIEQMEGHSRMVETKPKFSATVERWLSQGLIEWVDEGSEVGSAPRITPATSPDFLLRIQGSLQSIQEPSDRSNMSRSRRRPAKTGYQCLCYWCAPASKSEPVPIRDLRKTERYRSSSDRSYRGPLILGAGRPRRI